jgi:hypothetical protein
MDQRRLRLGDILDDYCPRERRVTNHAVVAMIEEDVKQTRCTTCDAEHVYKGGKAPRRKKSESTGVLYKQVLKGITDDPAASSSPLPSEAHDEHDEHDEEAEPAEEIASIAKDETPATAPVTALPAQHVEQDDQPGSADAEEPQPADEGPVHRPLIRAQLPRPEGVKVERQTPDFTIRNNGGRGNGNFRGAGGGDMRGRGGRGGHGGHGGHGGFGGGNRFGRGGGPNRGGGGNQRFDRGPRKRSR